MKRTIFLTFAIFMAITMLSCDFGPGEVVNEASNIFYDEFGRELIELEIDVSGGGRAMTATLAKLGIDFYEASFTQAASLAAISATSPVYRASWDFTQKGKIRLPAGTYTAASQAILLAGRQSDKTLLAIGVLTATTPGTVASPGAAATVTGGTSNLTFTLLPLTSDVHGRAQNVAGNPNNSSFLITYSGFETVLASSGKYETVPLPSVKMVTGQTVPVFLIPIEQQNVTAEFNVQINKDGTETTDYFAGVVRAGNPEAFFAGTSGTLTEASSLEVPMHDGLFVPSFPTTNVADGSVFLGKITFNFDTRSVVPATPTAKAGLRQFAFEYPVTAMSNANGSPIHWFIRGGLINGSLDEGAAANSNSGSFGGTVVLGIGAVQTGGWISITPNFP